MSNAQPAPRDDESPIRFELDTARRLRTAIFSGVITEQALISAYIALISDPAFEPTINDLVDLSGVTKLEVTSSGVRRVAQMFDPLNELQTQNRLAIVAPRDDLFGMARMYEILRSDAPEETRVCRTIEDAKAFLGVT